MDWTQPITIIIAILVAVGGGIRWIISRMDRKFDALEKRFDTIDKRFESIDQKMDRKFDQVLAEIKEIRKDIQGLDSRVSRIEGQLSPRYIDYPKERNLETKKSSSLSS